MKYPKGILIEEKDTSNLKVIDRDSIGFLGTYITRKLTITRCAWGDFEELGYFLDRKFGWVIVEDSFGNPVLIPLKKEKGINN